MLATFLSRIRSGRKAEITTAALARRFQAISIYRGVMACPIAHRFSDYRFLAKDAPQLPLSGCTMRQSCQCCYLKHKDRRAQPRRILDFSSSTRGYSGSERRLLRGRRSND